MPVSDLDISDLNPSMAIFPLRLAHGVTADVAIDRVVRSIETVVQVDPRKGLPRNGVGGAETIQQETVRGWTFAGAVYRVESAPSWIAKSRGSDGELLEDVDEETALVREGRRQSNWHLALVGAAQSAAGGRLVVHATQETVASQLREWLVSGRFGGVLLDDMTGAPFEDRVLQAVCLSGDTRQAALWGLHRTVKAKPDRKSLMGLDLREAMDPFSDQTYRLTSAVSLEPARSPTFLGLALEKQRVWSQKGKGVESFAGILDDLFVALEAAAATPPVATSGLGQKGFRDLAKTSEPREISKARGAFEVSFRPLSELDPQPADGGDGPEGDLDTLKVRQELAWFADGEVLFLEGDDVSPDVKVAVHRGRRHLMNLTLSPAPEDAAVALAAATEYQVPRTDPDVELFEALLEGEGLGRRFAIWYDTGHVLVDRQVSVLEYRDVRFDGWHWNPYERAGVPYAITEEKPMRPSAKDPQRSVADLERTGQANSLFDCILQEIPPMMNAAGRLWALCDDGAGEVADFVFFAPEDKRLWLVHAKGANSDAAGRELSLTAYEQVVSQARKNLRFFSGPALADELEKREAGKPLLWRGPDRVRAPADHAACMAQIVADLRATAFFENRELVVVQPHVSKRSWEAARKAIANGRDTKEVKAYRLLSTLLADLQMTAQKVDAGLIVLGHGAP